MLVWRATDDTQSRILSVSNATEDTSKYFTCGGIVNFTTDFDAVSKGKSGNQNSLAISFVYCNSSYGSLPCGKEAAQTYADGEVSAYGNNLLSAFDDGTAAEYEWTAYYWDE